MKTGKNFEEIVKTIAFLRSKNGCAWDKKQDFKSYYKYVLEEANEIKKAIKKEDFEELKEELGDLLWNIVFLSQIAKEKRLFEIDDVLDYSLKKMIRRHEHVFGKNKTKNIKKIIVNWKRIKKEEKEKKMRK